MSTPRTLSIRQKGRFGADLEVRAAEAPDDRAPVLRGRSSRPPSGEAAPIGRRAARKRTREPRGRERYSAKECPFARRSNWARPPHRPSPSRRTWPAWRPHVSPSAPAAHPHQLTNRREVPPRKRDRVLRWKLALRSRSSARLPPGWVEEKRALRDRRALPQTGRALPRTAGFLLTKGGSAFASMTRRAQSPAAESATTVTAVRVARADMKRMAHLRFRPVLSLVISRAVFLANIGIVADHDKTRARASK